MSLGDVWLGWRERVGEDRGPGADGIRLDASVARRSPVVEKGEGKFRVSEVDRRGRERESRN